MTSRRWGDEQAFTLIELLVVVLILGILAAIAVPVFLDQRSKAFRSAVASDVRNAVLVMESYSGDHAGAWTTDLASEGWDVSDGVTVAINLYSDGYCFEGTHDAFGATENWVLNATGAAATAAILHHFSGGGGSCPAGPIATGTVTG